MISWGLEKEELSKEKDIFDYMSLAYQWTFNSLNMGH